MEWCAPQWKAGLGFLSKTFDFRVQPFDFRVLPNDGPNRAGVDDDLDPDYRYDPDYHFGPAGHAISFKGRVLWLEANEEVHAEWLHEVAHLVCAPPWETSPENSNEFGGIFGWERAVAKEFLYRGLWTKADFKAFQRGQDVYGIGSTLLGWGGEWGAVPKGHQRIVLGFINRTLRLAGLLDAQNRPTWTTTPTWTEEVRARWKTMSNFKTNWSTIVKDSA